MAKLIDLKKLVYPIGKDLQKYLERHQRAFDLPLEYNDLTRYTSTMALYDSNDEDTLWTTVGYDAADREEIHTALLQIYALLSAHADSKILSHLIVDRIDLCMYGNTKPFRVRILNTLNENFDYFYVKVADASRVYGLELESILSPNKISFLYKGETLVEEHIHGIPGDMFIEKYMDDKLNEVRLAKEFVKFNERCLVYLLGDMHSSNFVVNITVDFEENLYRIRPIDFDQQSYEGQKRIYQPQFYKENNPIVNLGIKHLTWESVHQYQQEERALINRRAKEHKEQLNNLLTIMDNDHIAPIENVEQLRGELAAHYDSEEFLKCETMGQIVRQSLNEIASGKPKAR